MKTTQTLLLALVVAMVARVSADCAGDLDISELPYSIKITTTGDSESTTFTSLVCNTQCSATEYCQPLKSFAVSVLPSAGATTSPASTTTDCGLAITDANLGSLNTKLPSDPEHCEAFLWSVPKANAVLADMCGDCKIQMTLANGVVAVTGGKTPAPAPGPQPYARRRSLMADEAVVTSYGTRRRMLADPVVTSYGSRRRSLLAEDPVVTSYGSRRRVLADEPVTTAYGSRRRMLAEPEVTSYGSRRL